MFKEYLLKKVLDSSFQSAKDKAKSILRKSKGELKTTRYDIEESLGIHLRSIENWSSGVSFNDLKASKSVTDIFIELQLFVYPRRIRIDPTEAIGSIPFRNIFDYSVGHVALLGQPGAGKTTSMKYLCQLLLHDADYHPERFSFPLLIKFRDINPSIITPESMLITEQIWETLGLTVIDQEGKSEVTGVTKSMKEKLVINFLEEFRVLLILDGLDELAPDIKRSPVIKEIDKYATHLSRSTMLITSRTSEFKYNLDNTAQFEICPLSPKQIDLFAEKWLSDQKEASDFLSKIYRTPFADTAIRPLTLAHLCAIYERIKDIPEKPKTVYKKIVNLLLEEWDHQRAVKRASKYANFEVDRKYEFLCNLAYVLTRLWQKTVFSTRDLLAVYHEIHDQYELKENEAEQVISEIETHNGLFLQTGYEQFEFAHKSLQEFLAAEHIVKLPTIPDGPILEKIPNELAVATAISSHPSDYFSELILNRFKGKRLSEDFLATFLGRLLIEKPDFHSTMSLELSWLVLSSHYIENYVIKDIKPNHIYLDQILKEFDERINALPRRTKNLVLQCYEADRNFITEAGKDIQRIIKFKKLRAAHHQALSGSVPNILYVKKSLL